MRKLAIIFACGLVAQGCSGSSDPTPASTSDSETQAEAPKPILSTEEGEVTIGTMQMDNFEMRFYNTLTSTDDGQTPTFYLQADAANSDGESGMKLERPNAVIYSEDDQSVRLNAESGLIDERNETALLSGGVTAEMANVNLSLEKLHYDNKERIAHSDSPVHLEGEIAILDAQSVNIRPDDGIVELYEVSGRIRLGEDTP